MSGPFFPQMWSRRTSVPISGRGGHTLWEGQSLDGTPHALTLTWPTRVWGLRPELKHIQGRSSPQTGLATETVWSFEGNPRWGSGLVWLQQEGGGIDLAGPGGAGASACPSTPKEAGLLPLLPLLHVLASGPTHRRAFALAAPPHGAPSSPRLAPPTGLC